MGLALINEQITLRDAQAGTWQPSTLCGKPREAPKDIAGRFKEDFASLAHPSHRRADWSCPQSGRRR